MAAKSRPRRSAAGTVAAVERWHGPDDPRLPELRQDLHAVGLAERIHEGISGVDEPDAFADRVAASLPPLTPDEAIALGRLAAALDARRSVDQSGAAA